MRPELKLFTITFRNGDTRTVGAVHFQEKGPLIVFFDHNGHLLGVPKWVVQSIDRGDTAARDFDVTVLD
jgi:hypothetical protein